MRWIKERRHITWGDITQEVEVEAVRPRSPRSSKNEAWLQSELDLVPEIGEAARREEIVCFDNQEVRFELNNLCYGGLVRSRMSALHGVTIKPGFPRWLLPTADKDSRMGIRPRIRP